MSKEENVLTHLGPFLKMTQVKCLLVPHFMPLIISRKIWILLKYLRDNPEESSIFGCHCSGREIPFVLVTIVIKVRKYFQLWKLENLLRRLWKPPLTEKNPLSSIWQAPLGPFPKMVKVKCISFITAFIIFSKNLEFTKYRLHNLEESMIFGCRPVEGSECSSHCWYFFKNMDLEDHFHNLEEPLILDINFGRKSSSRLWSLWEDNSQMKMFIVVFIVKVRIQFSNGGDQTLATNQFLFRYLSKWEDNSQMVMHKTWRKVPR